MEVRDPIHGAISLDGNETTVADNPWVQRLRNIRQTGFSYLPFPGATHSRYSHSLGVMHLAGRAFDSCYRNWQFTDPGARARFRQAVRLAALCHDLGHPPFSHCMEFAMPPLAELGIRWYRPEVSLDRTASHEDWTIAVLEQTSLTQDINAHFEVTARHVAAVISGDVVVEDDFFMDGGLDHRRALSQIVSSELDVDRMDYLPRDAFHTGVRYGQVDVNWLISNLDVCPVDGEVCLAMDSRAVYAFDHFLLARHHMFLMVYFHHKSVVYEELLRRYVSSPDCPWRFPDIEGWLHVDDITLTAHLRQADDPWARRVVERRPYRRAVERHGSGEDADLAASEQQLLAAGIDVISAASIGQLSRYTRFGRKRRGAPTIWVLERIPGQPIERITPLADASKVFEHYAEDRRISRLYVPPERVNDARAILGLPTG